jgi:SpoVK/Ycf46/Vps4 family AAA+-type ATPase
LESSRGLVILASNVKDQIDPAFTRRFQIAVHFPKPGVEERLRIWRLAFPPNAPLDHEIDFHALSQLEMTGAAIVGAARTAALLAADSASPQIGMQHVIRATARQYRREARVLTPTDLGQYGALLQGVT